MDVTWIYVECDPETMGGKPVFASTLIPVHALFDYLGNGETLEQFLRDFPTVTIEQAVEVLRQAGEMYVHAAILGLTPSPTPTKSLSPPKKGLRSILARLKR